jgi:acyl transferase domain-containing protein/acyl carrier protein
MDESNMTPEGYTGLELAVIGMAGRFPGARNIDEFWENLKNGIEPLWFLSDEEVLAAGEDPQTLENPSYVKMNGFLEEVEYFDASFFGYTSREAEKMDPQVRIFHQIAWETLESAGYNPDLYEGLIGVYAGANNNSSWMVHFMNTSNTMAEKLEVSNLSNSYAFCTRVSYKLNLRGPSVTVQTACSTSLVAVHMACQGLLCGECDIALAGGSSIYLLEKTGYLYQEGMILSPDGHCRTFDQRAKGTVMGDGVGMVALKRLESAIAERDTILAVIKASGINNDGNQKIGYEAPSMKGQADLISEVQHRAGIEPESIGYVETHGTATPMGDPVEISALTMAFNTTKRGFCRIGSVKSNFGHLNSSAGIAGFIKTVLALQHQLIPPTLHFDTANPEIDFENSPFVVNSELFVWNRDKYPLRAAVNSLGGGGTNAHVILEEAPVIAQSPVVNGNIIREREYQLILLSAKTESSLGKLVENLAEYLKQHPEINLADAAYTLQVGRRHFQRRRMLVCSDRDEAVEIISSPSSGKLYSVNLKAKENEKQVIFMFPGQGSQYVNMGWGLYKGERVFREEMDRCFDIFKSITGHDIKEILYTQLLTHQSQPADNPGRINRTEISQPVIFMFEYALGKLLMSWGIQPTVMIGYSFGEYAAACLSGVFSLEDILKVIVLRSRLMQNMPEAAMLSVPLPADELKPLLNEKLSISIDNGPSCVVAGTVEEIDEFEKVMKEKRYICIRVSVSHPGHSSVMSPILSEFAEEVKRLDLHHPQIPFISNVTGTAITDQDAVDPHYWVRHLKDTARFGEGAAELLTIPDSIFIEVGAGRDLCVLLKSFKDFKPTHRVTNLVRHEKEDVPDLYYLLNRIGHLWLYGVNIDWQGFHADEQRYRIPLPTYNFEKQSFKITGISSSFAEQVKQPGTALKRNDDTGEWLYAMMWKRSRIPRTAEKFVRPGQTNRMRILVFIDEWGLGSKITVILKQQGYLVTLVRTGETFRQIKEDEYSIQPATNSDYERLFNEIIGPGKLPAPLAILHLWNVTPVTGERRGIEWMLKEQDKGFYSLIALAQTLGKQYINNHFQVKVVTNNIQDVIGGEVICPDKATISGPAKVITQEYSNIDCCMIDIELPETGSRQEQILLNRLIEEFQVKIQDRMIAYRNGYRWVQTFDSVKIEKPQDPTNGNVPVGLREKGIYLITGGTGGIGLILAEHLAREAKARLILTCWSSFPERDEWDNWLTAHSQDDKVSTRVRKIRELEAMGAEVLLYSADVASFDQMQQVIKSAEQSFGRINGVIHAAGIPDGAIIAGRTREISEKVLTPKVTGTLVLDQLLKNAQLDFFILCSSMASILPMGGQTAYSAANAFLDAFAASSLLCSTKNPISIIWDRWHKIGVAVIAEEKHKEIWGVELEKGITPSEGLDIFNRILSDPLSRVLVTPFDLANSVEEYNNPRGLLLDDINLANLRPKSIQKRPELSIPYVKPGNEAERKLAELWENFLGIERIGIHDNFFELGATSLAIIQISVFLVKEFGRDIQPVAMYSYPTVESLAKFLELGNLGDDFFAKEQHAFETRDKGQEIRKNLRLKRRNIQPGENAHE